MGRPRLVRVLAAVSAAVALVLAPAGSASAHDVLVGTAPADDATVETAPAGVTLGFSDAPRSLGTTVVVTGPDGRPASEGAPQLTGSTVTQPLADGLPAGTYTVDWRATSADGHPLSGTFVFAVTEGSPPGQAVAADDDGPGSAASGAPSFSLVWVAIALIAAAGVVLVVRQLRRPA